VNVDELIAVLSAEPEQVLPFVGSGMTIAAGASSTPTLAGELARRAGIALGGNLTAVSAAAERAVGLARTREILAEVITSLRLHATPALTAICGVPGGRVLTPNYDDAIERSAIGRGLKPLSLAATDRRMLDTPGTNQLQVVHLHGMPGDPSSLVLPGSTTNALVADEVFTTFMRATMAHSRVLYLGFSLGLAEIHLRAILAWLDAAVTDVPDHYLLLSAEEVRAREADIGLLDSFDFLKVIPYDPEPDHVAVERVAVTLAPRIHRERRQQPSGRTEPTWVQPILLQAEAAEGHKALQQRVASFDFGWTGAEAVLSAEGLLDLPRTIVVAGPGMGKTTLVEGLPSMASGRTCARGELRGFSPAGGGLLPERAIARLLRRDDGEQIAIEDLRGSGALLLLDGLDEVGEDLREDAVRAIEAASAAWPEHSWVVTSRPGDAADALAAEEFTPLHILPSRRWARAYLETRGVPADRTERAMLDGYGLGDLLGVPLFAARLADRLLEGSDANLSPLELLVDEQYAATAREARRHGEERADLGGWLRSLAIALELRGRASAPTAELAAVVGPGGLAAEAARSQLVAATLLADVPGTAAFALRTLQQGLCADAILKAKEPAAVLRYAASAQVAGVERLREDIEFTIDLVFEHADRDLREALKEIDPMRWARTVVTRGELADAREAFLTIWQWHVERGLNLVRIGEDGLRTSRRTIRAIAQRWPEVIDERRDELEAHARGGSSIERARALAVLGELRFDGHTDGWLLPRLEDGDPQVVMLAAEIAGRLRLASAEPALRRLFATGKERVARGALAALVEVVDVPALAEIGAQAASRNMLQPVAERVLERIDLDTGIELVARSGHTDGILPWFTEQLIKTVHADAWTATRVAALMRACRQMGVGGMPDVAFLAGIFAKHPAEAIAEVFVQRVGEGPYAPAGQLLPLGHLDPALLAGDDRVQLREALERARREVDERKENAERHERALGRLRLQLDTCGGTLQPQDLDLTFGSLRRIEPHYRAVLGELVDRWWPQGGLGVGSGEERLNEPTRIMLMVGSEIRAPIAAARWRELLDAHLVAHEWAEGELAAHGVTAWLAATYRGDYEGEIATRLPAADAKSLAKLLAISGRKGCSERLVDLMFTCLGQLASRDAGWINIVAMLVEAGHYDRVRELLTGDVPDAAREAIVARLAQHGEAAAQVEVLGSLAQAVERGELPQRPHWPAGEHQPDVVAAAARLSDVALAHNSEDLAGFALGVVQSAPDAKALALLDDLAMRHRATWPWLQLSVEHLARRIATREVLLRLPESLDAVASEFRAKAERTVLS
jgi:hypothetical protein